MSEVQVAQRIQAYLTRELGYPAELIQREYQTSRSARLDLVVVVDGQVKVVCEAKRLDKLPSDVKLLPFDALIRQVQFAALEVGARYFLISDGNQMLWFETDGSGRPVPLATPKAFPDLANGKAESQSLSGRVEVVRRTLRNILERSRQQRWSHEALALVVYAHLQRQRGREVFCDLLVGGSVSQAALAAIQSKRPEELNTGFVETLAFVARQDLTAPHAYEEALDLLDASALDKLAPANVLSLLDEVLVRYPTTSGATRIPRWTSDLLVRLAGIERGDRVLDLHCGLGNLSAAVRLSGITPPSRMAFFARHAIDAMWACIQQLVFGAELPSVEIGDPLESLRLSHQQEDLADRILVAAPFGLTVRHARFAERRGSAISSEEAYVELALERLSPRGRMVALLPNGSLGKPDRSQVRELLLRNGLQAVLDIGAFQPGSGVAASVVVLDKSMPARDTLFFAKALNPQPRDTFDCTSLPGLPHVLQRFGFWMQGHEIGSDELGLTATSAPVQGVLSVGPYLALPAQTQLSLSSFEHQPLGSLALVTKGGAIRRSKATGDVVFIGPGAVRPLQIQLDLLDRADDAEVQRFPNAIASEGDIVLNGISTYVGAAAFIESGRFHINRHIFRIRVHNVKVLPEYLAIAINSRYVHEPLVAFAGGGVMPMLRVDTLRQILIPVPPRDVQAEIVRRVAIAKAERDKAEILLQEKEQGLSTMVRNLDFGDLA